MVSILQTHQFQRSIKKLHKNQKHHLDDAVRTIMSAPDIGEMKRGDLAGVQVYKFKVIHQLMLLAYLYDKAQKTITLLALGTHENFYRDLKKRY